MGGPNHPFVVWATCFLWLVSIFSVTWSLMLFFLLGDNLIITNYDLINATVLLLGIVMMPQTFHMLYMIAKGFKIEIRGSLLCCPLWLFSVWIIIIDCVGIAVCLYRIHCCKETASKSLEFSMDNYRGFTRYKRYLDNLQWSLKCCGLNSYKDWFEKDWYDKIRDYEWDPSSKRKRDAKTLEFVSDSVPLSCCKSGSCVSNFLTELGTHSINTRGCQMSLYRLMMLSLYLHVMFFFCILVTQILLLHFVSNKNQATGPSAVNLSARTVQINNLMAVNNKFEMTSCSSSCNNDSDEEILSKT